jgi:hypothetical protein
LGQTRSVEVHVARARQILAPADQAALQAEAAKLGGAQAPASLSPTQQGQVQLAIRLALVDMFRVVMWIAAGLAWLSAALAWLLVEKRVAPARVSGEGELAA